MKKGILTIIDKENKEIKFNLLTNGKEERFIKKLTKANKKGKLFNFIDLDGYVQTINCTNIKHFELEQVELPSEYMYLNESDERSV